VTAVLLLAQASGEESKLWWHLARSSGIVAWALAALAVLWGVALATRALGRRPQAPWLLAVHRFLGLLCIVFVGVHLAALYMDPFINFGLDDLFVPLASSWKPVAVAWGVVALYLLIAVEITSLLRQRLPARVWRGVHFSSYAMYVLATVHLLAAGTDRTNPVLLGSVVATVAVTLFFLAYRVVGPGRAASVRRAAASSMPTGVR
jgi:DMSO/TMAO reductase YedYZ heme-binding membrane subunit